MIKKPIVVYGSITIGVILIALAYYFLYLPQNLVIGGVTGIAIILKNIFINQGFQSSIFIYILNGILLIVGWLVLGRDFLFKTIYGSILLPTVILLLEISNINPGILFTFDNEILGITNEIMSPISQTIIAVLLGSLFTGCGLGLCFRNNASTGGMDVIQKIIVKIFHFPFSKTVYITDGLIILLSIFVLGIERGIYSLISIVLTGIVIDFFCMGASLKRTAFVLSVYEEEITSIIINKLGRGVTIVPVLGGYSEKKYNMIICTLSKGESYLMRDLVLEVDPNAFQFYVSAKEVYGDGF